MYFSERFDELSLDMYNFLNRTSVEELVIHGFKVGTASKIINYTSDDLKNTTINTLRRLVKVIDEVEGGDIDFRFQTYLEDSFRLIDKVPHNVLISDTGFSPSAITGIKEKGVNGNYQTSKFINISDAALRYMESEERMGK